MAYNPLWGVGRENKTLPTPIIVSNSTSNTGIGAGASPTPVTISATIPSHTQITHFQVSCNALNRTQNPTNGRITINIDGSDVVSYLLPDVQTAGDVIPVVNEQVSYSFYSPAPMTFNVTLSADNGGTTGTVAMWNIRCVGFGI
jgi:hypothetical protein